MQKLILNKNKNLDAMRQEEHDIMYQMAKSKVIKVNFSLKMVKNEK